MIELDLPPPARQPKDIFETAEKGGNVYLRYEPDACPRATSFLIIINSKASMNPFRIIQKFIILNRMDECFEYFAGPIRAGRSHEYVLCMLQVKRHSDTDGLAKRIPHLPSVLRILTHYIILLRPFQIAPNDQATNTLIKSYVELLAEANKVCVRLCPIPKIRYAQD